MTSVFAAALVMASVVLRRRLIDERLAAMVQSVVTLLGVLAVFGTLILPNFAHKFSSGLLFFHSSNSSFIYSDPSSLADLNTGTLSLD